LLKAVQLLAHGAYPLSQFFESELLLHKRGDGMARPCMVAFLLICVASFSARAATVVWLDNNTAGVTLTNTWNTSTSVAGYYGANYSHNNKDVSSTATYSPTLPYAGQYLVEAIWCSDSNREKQATYTVNHVGGPTVVIKDQSVGGGTWQTLGTFDFTGTSADSIVLTTPNSDGYLIADGMRFIDPATLGGEREHWQIAPAGLTASASSTINAPQNGRVPQAAVNASGMHDYDLDNLLDTHDASQFGDYISWMSTGGDTAGWFVVNLGDEYVLERIKFWNFNSAQEKDRGVSQGDWYVSTADNPTGRNFATDPDWSLIVNDFSFAIAPGANNYNSPDVIEMGGAPARWVALDIDGNWGDGNFVGISEMQFFQREAPEPLTLTALLAGAGLAGGYLRRRRLQV